SRLARPPPAPRLPPSSPPFSRPLLDLLPGGASSASLQPAPLALQPAALPQPPRSPRVHQPTFPPPSAPPRQPSMLPRPPTPGCSSSHTPGRFGALFSRSAPSHACAPAPPPPSP